MNAENNLFANDSITDTSSTILFGQDQTERIVAAEATADRLMLWQRLADGSIRQTEEPCLPWALLTERNDSVGAEYLKLDGGAFRFLYSIPGSRFQEVRRQLRDRHAEVLTYPSATKLALIKTGKTLFKGITLDDTVRMQVDIETTGLTWNRPEDRILVIAVRDTNGLLDALIGDERDILEQFAAIVCERDPDIIEGHNLFGFDLPFMIARAQRHGIRLPIGRDGSEIRVGQERNYAIGGASRPFAPAYIFGRHVVDTYLAVQRFDWAKGELTSYGLKPACRQLGIALDDRVEIDRTQVQHLFDTDRERLLEYAKQDVIETGRLADLVTATEFYQTQMVPDSYGACAVTGTGEKINSLFIRAYLAAGCGIPRSKPSSANLGGYTELRMAGVLHRVVKADVESLYPSLMLTEKIAPASDHLGVFLPALRELTTRRLAAKSKAKSLAGTEAHYWDGIQNSFKVLINSFYGYLGANVFYFNDFAAAGKVTALGREMVVRIAGKLETTGSKVIEIDTDGVYFIPPDTIHGLESEEAYVAKIGEILPTGIRLAFDGRYKTMVSLKTKNYVLYGYDGKRVLKGASLRSRAEEAFGRDFLESALDMLVDSKFDELSTLYATLVEDIRNGKLPLDKLIRRERITSKTQTSSAKGRARAIAGKLAVGEFMRVYEKKDGSLGRAEEYTPGDENRTYYMEKLYKFASRLREAFGGEFDRIIRKPTASGLEGEHQLEMDLS